MKYGTQTPSSGQTAQIIDFRAALLRRHQLVQPEKPAEVFPAVADAECWYHDEALEEDMKKAD